MKRIRVLDFEATHPTPAEGGLVAIAYTDVVAMGNDLVGDPFDWEVAEGRMRLCNPGCAVPPETAAIHHILDEDVAAEPFWQALVAGLMKSGPADGVIAYAAHSVEFEALWIDPKWLPEPVPFVCTYKSALRKWRESPGHSNMVLRYYRRPVGIVRESAVPEHNPLVDSYVTAFHLRDLLNDERCSIEQMVEWTGQPAFTTRCYLDKYRNDGRGTPWEEVETDYLEWIVSKGFHDRPDIRYTAEVYLADRRQDEAAARERRALDDQLRQNDLPVGPVEPESKPVSAMPIPSSRPGAARFAEGTQG